jgi:hypothetical protein
MTTANYTVAHKIVHRSMPFDPQNPLKVWTVGSVRYNPLCQTAYFTDAYAISNAMSRTWTDTDTGDIVTLVVINSEGREMTEVETCQNGKQPPQPPLPSDTDRIVDLATGTDLWEPYDGVPADTVG